MRSTETAWLRLCCLALAATSAALAREVPPGTEFSNMWIAQIDGGEAVARRIARDYGYNYDGPAEPFEEHYILTRDDHPLVNNMNSHHLTTQLTDLPEVSWAEQQIYVVREKKNIIPEESFGLFDGETLRTEQQLWASLDFKLV